MGIEGTGTVSTGEATDRTAAQAPAQSRSRRAMGVDVARAVALVGMFAVHIFPTENDDGGANWAFAIFGGRAAALFAVLAGVSIAFVEKRSRGQLHGRTLTADRAALVVRGLLILLAGLLLGDLELPFLTIIPYLGVLFLLAIPFYGRSSRLLLLTAAACAILGPILRHLAGGHVPEQADTESDYTLLTAAQQPLAFIWDMLLTGFYPALLWMVYLCVGIVIGRQVLTSRRLALFLLGWGSALAIVAWGASRMLLGPLGGAQRLAEATPDLDGEEISEVLVFGLDAVDGTMMPTTTWWWLTPVAPYSETPFNLLHNLGAVVALLGLALLLTNRGGKVFSPFAAIGAMTLTLYSAHCIIFVLELLPEDRPMMSWWVLIISFMLFALIWGSSMGRGPLERIISEASDWVRQRVRKPRHEPPSDPTDHPPPRAEERLRPQTVDYPVPQHTEATRDPSTPSDGNR